MKKVLENIIPLWMLMTSGGLVLVSNAKMSMLLFVAFSILYYIHCQGKVNNKALQSNLLLLIPLGLWPFINTRFLQNSADLTSIQPLMFSLGTLLFVSCMNFYKFREIIHKWLNIICIASIIAFLAYYFLGFPARIISYPLGDFNMVLGLFNMGSADNYRLAAIYWEPGQFQIVIYFVLCLFLDEWSDFSRIRQNFRKHFFIIAALILTFSTAGYLVLIVYVAAMMLSLAKKSKKQFILWPLSVIVIGVFGYFVLNSAVITDKFEDIDSEGTSAAVRLQDTLGSLEIIKGNPLTGVGMASKEFERLRFLNDMRAASNGWLKMAAEEGIPYMLILLFSIFSGIKRMNLGTPTIIVLLILVMSQSNEFAAYFPYIWMYVYAFGSYNAVSFGVTKISSKTPPTYKEVPQTI